METTGSEMSLTEAELRRRGHRKLGLQELKQAPALSTQSGVKEAVRQWCLVTGRQQGMAGWRKLGQAILVPSVGAQLQVAVGSICGEEGFRMAAAWLLWHRRRRAFSKKALKGGKWSSKAHGVWVALRRGAKAQACGEWDSSCGVKTNALSGKAALVLARTRSQGLVYCDVGRTPLHLPGELPSAQRTRGHVRRESWVKVQLGAASESELLELMDRTGGWAEARLRHTQLEQRLVVDLLKVGEGKITTSLQLFSLVEALRRGGDQARCIETWRRSRATTLTTSQGWKWLRITQVQRRQLCVEVLNAQDWASLMGVPPVWEHPIRRGLREVSDAAGRSIMGQAIHLGVAIQLIRHFWKQICGGEGCLASGPRYVSLMSGIDMVAAAVDYVSEGRWSFELAAEANATVALALQAAWRDKLKVVASDALGQEAVRRLIALAGRVDVLMVSLRCAPWSAANTLSLASKARQEQMERALEESQALLNLAVTVFPRVIIMECVTGLLRRCMRKYWERLQGIIRSFRGWRWARQVICPQRTLQGWMPRRRVWIVGVLRTRAASS